jgi:hypothetical protein
MAKDMSEKMFTTILLICPQRGNYTRLKRTWLQKWDIGAIKNGLGNGGGGLPNLEASKRVRRSDEFLPQSGDRPGVRDREAGNTRGEPA